MKKKASLVIIAAYFAMLFAASMVTDLMGLAGLLLILGGILAVLPVALWLGMRHLRRKPFLTWALLVPILMVAGGAFALMVCIVRAPSPVLADGADVSAQLAYMHKTDQGDRYTLRFLHPGRDRARRERVLDLHTNGLIEAPDDQYAAALILQHGTTPDHFELAHHYATAARDAGVGGADWLFRATYDRWMLSIGEPARYGTQHGFTIGGGGD